MPLTKKKLAQISLQDKEGKQAFEKIKQLFHLQELGIAPELTLILGLNIG